MQTANIWKKTETASIDEYNIRQIILVRRDLKMPPLKLAAQAGHASLGGYLKDQKSAMTKKWLTGKFTKISLYVDSEEEMNDIVNKAEAAGLNTCIITDSGKTVFNGVPTVTCASIGPSTREILAPITGHLKTK